MRAVWALVCLGSASVVIMMLLGVYELTSIVVRHPKVLPDALPSYVNGGFWIAALGALTVFAYRRAFPPMPIVVPNAVPTGATSDDEALISHTK